MKNLTLNDSTQTALLPHIKTTEEMLGEVLAYLNSNGAEAEITVLPDLGLSNNTMRMNGGFFTGMFIRWTSQVPFVPVDTTVNSCGVYIFTLKDNVSKNEFAQLLLQAKRKVDKLGHTWNYERGNHFITIGAFPDGSPCVVMHASADEYKYSNSEESLYPYKNCWYDNDIKTYRSEKYPNRYLRYISGDSAKRFVNIAAKLDKLNRERHYEIAIAIFGNLFDNEYLYAPHYGMPTTSSIAIGCSWTESKFALLTAPKKSIYIVEPIKETLHGCDASANLSLNPHGFGVELASPHIQFKPDSLYVNGVAFNSDDASLGISGRGIRMRNADDNAIEEYVKKILSVCHGKPITVIKPCVSLCSTGACATPV